MAEERISAKFKAQAQRNVIVGLTLLGLIYAFFFLPEAVLSYFKDELTAVWNTLLTLGLSGAVGGALGNAISAQDLLATGKSRAAQFFRNEYPSTAIANRYHCTQAEANSLWFNIFNPWENIGPLKESYARTFQRGAECRFLFVLQRSLAVFFLLCLLTWAGTWGWSRFAEPLDPSKPIAVFARVAVLTVTFVIACSLFWLNRYAGPTGCWARWQEINGIHRAWLDHEVFATAATYQDAMGLIASAAWRQAHGYV